MRVPHGIAADTRSRIVRAWPWLAGVFLVAKKRATGFCDSWTATERWSSRTETGSTARRERLFSLAADAGDGDECWPAGPAPAPVGRGPSDAWIRDVSASDGGFSPLLMTSGTVWRFADGSIVWGPSGADHGGRREEGRGGVHECLRRPPALPCHGTGSRATMALVKPPLAIAYTGLLPPFCPSEDGFASGCDPSSSPESSPPALSVRSARLASPWRLPMAWSVSIPPPIRLPQVSKGVSSCALEGE